MGESAKRGAVIYESICITCHGKDGISIAPNYPILAGQHADYMTHALRQYRSGERKNPKRCECAQFHRSISHG